MTTLLRRVFYAVATFLLLALPVSSAPEVLADTGTGPNVTYAGFRLLPDGRSLVYVELSAPVEVRVSRRGTNVVYTLEGAKVPLKNNKHPLNTSAFASNVVSVRLIQTGEPAGARSRNNKKAAATSPIGVDLAIDLRVEVTPTHALVKSASGAVLEVTVPAAPGR